MRNRSWVEVSRSAIAANYRAVRAVVGSGVTVAPVVKADAYRHGAVELASVLERAGAGWLCVSNVDEGVTLREAGVQARILVMADSLPASLRAMPEYGLTPVLHDPAEMATLDRGGAPVPFHLKIDSGMGRLGTLAESAAIARAARQAPNCRFEGLMTHFASAADYTGPQTDEQLARFEGVSSELAGLGAAPAMRHASSTIAVAYGRREAWFDLVRPGHAIYGYVSPVRAKGTPPANLLAAVRPALTWKARLLAIKDAPSGARIGYGAQFTAPRDMRIGIVAAGYADGIPHRLSNKGRVIAAGQWAPLLGAVSMDVCTIDLTAVPAARPGDAVTIIGREGDCEQDAQQLARVAGSISYSVLCGISARVERVYVE